MREGLLELKILKFILLRKKFSEETLHFADNTRLFLFQRTALCVLGDIPAV